MNDKNINSLNKKFSFDTNGCYAQFKVGEGDIPVLEVKNEKASAIISLQGAHILKWKPLAKDDVIWLSKEASFSAGKSVRGGIPVCWPWFGAHENEASYPAHGFARTVMWQVTDINNLSPGKTQVSFKLETVKLDKKLTSMWPQDTVLEYRITISEKLTLELVTSNNSNEDMVIGQALHTYFKVKDISNTTVSGLEDKTYLDKTKDFNSMMQHGVITFSDEVDRVYLDTADDVIINDNHRKIKVSKQGSHSTVVWNPWKQVANKMGDLGRDGYKEMLCVESANAADDVVIIEPGSSHYLLVNYEILD